MTTVTTNYWHDGEIVEEDSFENTDNVSLDVKQIFTSFAQYYFENHGKFTWEADLRSTKIIIADKNTIDLGVIERRPGILVSRASMAWNFTPGQSTGLGVNPDAFGFDEAKANLETKLTDFSATRREYTDLVSGAVVFNCMSKSGLQAEEIASELFAALVGYKTEIYKHGIHAITSISMGEEQTLRSGSTPAFSVVPVRVSYQAQRHIGTSLQSYNLTVEVDDVEIYEGTSFLVTPGNTQDYLSFRTAPEDEASIVAAYYQLSAPATLVTDEFTGNGETTEFLLSTKPYGYFKIFADYIATITYSQFINTTGNDAEDYWDWITISGAYQEEEVEYTLVSSGIN